MTQLILSGDTSGSVTLTIPAAVGNNTITIPAGTGTAFTQYTVSYLVVAGGAGGG